uniref:diacylglycerol O-acyltransferase n=1 Tax=viral metagenome TaxID=1070528 RepID=A0A6C0CJ90_9ZZZZ
MSWIYLWPLAFLGVLGLLLLVVLLMASNLLMGLAALSLYGLTPKDALFDSVVARLRNESVEENLRATFPMVDCPPDLPPTCIFVWNPHGLISVSSALFNSLRVCRHPNYKANHAVALSMFHYIPVISDIARYAGIISSDYGTIKKTLLKNESVSVMLGGVREMNLADPRKMVLYVKKRTGIFKIAAETGTPLVPVITYGENELFPRSDNWFVEQMNVWLHSSFGLSVPVPSWTSLLHWFEVSYRSLKPIPTYVGSPITDKDPDLLKEKYIAAVQTLFSNTSPPDYSLDII